MRHTVIAGNLLIIAGSVILAFVIGTFILRIIAACCAMYMIKSGFALVRQGMWRNY